MQAEATPERKYALMKIAPGDYLLPSNDGQTIWRIRRYVDGPSMGLEIPKDRNFWGVWRWLGSPDRVDLDDWSSWSLEVDFGATRAEAIREALEREKRERGRSESA